MGEVPGVPMILLLVTRLGVLVVRLFLGSVFSGETSLDSLVHRRALEPLLSATGRGAGAHLVLMMTNVTAAHHVLRILTHHITEFEIRCGEIRKKL